MLYAAGVPDRDAMKNRPHVGVASVWWEGNPCNMHRQYRILPHNIVANRNGKQYSNWAKSSRKQ